MEQHEYEIIVEEEGYTIVFPLLPGCISWAKTEDEIPQMADEALSLWLEVTNS